MSWSSIVFVRPHPTFRTPLAVHDLNWPMAQILNLKCSSPLQQFFPILGWVMNRWCTTVSKKNASQAWRREVLVVLSTRRTRISPISTTPRTMVKITVSADMAVLWFHLSCVNIMILRLQMQDALMERAATTQKACAWIATIAAGALRRPGRALTPTSYTTRRASAKTAISLTTTASARQRT